MKKILVILLFAIMSFSFISCEKNNSVPTMMPSSTSTQLDVVPDRREVPFTLRGYTCAGIGDDYDSRLFFCSRDDLDSYYEENSAVLGSRFMEFCEKYDDAYFENQVLIGILDSRSMATNYEVQSLQEVEREYILTIKSITAKNMVVPCMEYPPNYLFIEPEKGHKITASNFEVEWIKETVE